MLFMTLIVPLRRFGVLECFVIYVCVCVCKANALRPIGTQVYSIKEFIEFRLFKGPLLVLMA